VKHQPFEFSPGEPRNPRAWLGVAALVRARVFPVVVGAVRLVPFDDDIQQLHEVARRCEDGRCTPEWQWRRVLLPFLPTEVEKRGFNVE
jgi:hypothetical protein